MTKISGYGKFLFPVLLIAAAVLCALPFFAKNSEYVYIYTQGHTPTQEEQDFIAALKEKGRRVRINVSDPQDAALWFRPPETASTIAESSAKYNFIYNEVHNVFDWRGMPTPPIVLTPHRDIFEHYTRSNIKTALFDFENKQQAAQRFLEILNWLKINNAD